MKRIIFEVVFLLLMTRLLCQEKVSYSFQITPIISKSFLNSNKDSVIHLISSKDYIHNRYNLDIPLVGYKISLNINYKLNYRIEIYSGLNYTHQRITHSFVFPIAKYIVVDGQSYTVTGFYGTFYSSYHYISIPIGVQMNILKINKNSLSIGNSYSIDYLVGSKDIKPILSTPTYYERYFEAKNFCLAGNLGIQYEFLYNESVSLYIRPNFNLNLTPNLVDRDAINQFNYYIGIDFGIRFHLQKKV